MYIVRVVPGTQTDGRVVGHLRQCWSHPLSRLLRSWWRVIVVILTPLIFLPIPIILKDDVSRYIVNHTLCTYMQLHFDLLEAILCTLNV